MSVFFAGVKVTSHALRLLIKSVINSCGQFKSILVCLISFPCSLSIALLLSKSLVLFLQSLELSLLSSGVLILEHASHSSDSGGLFSIVSILLLVAGVLVLVLLGLLLNPLLLLFSLVLDALGVEQVLALELGAAGSEGWHILFWTIETLASSLHICSLNLI